MTIKAIGTWVTRFECCGIVEYTGFNRGNWTIEAMMAALLSRANQRYEATCGHAAFGRLGCCTIIGSEVQQCFKYHVSGRSSGRSRIPKTAKNIRQLQKFVRDKNLGTVTIQKQTKNPNSGNLLCTMVWTLDQKGITRYLTKLKKPRGRPKKEKTKFTIPDDIAETLS